MSQSIPVTVQVTELESLSTLPSYSVSNPLLKLSALPYGWNWPSLVSSLPLLFWCKTAWPLVQSATTSTSWPVCCPLPRSKVITSRLQGHFSDRPSWDSSTAKLWVCQLWFSYFYLLYLPGSGYLFSFIILLNRSSRKTVHFASIVTSALSKIFCYSFHTYIRFILWMWVFCLHMSVYHACMRFPRTGVTGNFKPLCGRWELSLL